MHPKAAITMANQKYFFDLNSFSKKSPKKMLALSITDETFEESSQLNGQRKNHLANISDKNIRILPVY